MPRQLTRRSLLGTFCVAPVGSLAGCSNPLDDEHDIDYALANDDEDSYDLELFVLSSEDPSVEVTFDDGSTETHAAGDLGPVVGTDPNRIASVRPLAEPLDAASYSLDAGDLISGRFEDVPGGSSVTGVATPPGGGPPLEGFGSMWCSPNTDVMDIEIRLTERGMHSQVSCRGR